MARCRYVNVANVAANRLHRIVMSGADAPYMYYWVPAPWLTVKLLRLLQIFPLSEDPAVRKRVREAISRLIDRSKEMPPAKNAMGQPIKPKIQYVPPPPPPTQQNQTKPNKTQPSFFSLACQSSNACAGCGSWSSHRPDYHHRGCIQTGRAPPPCTAERGSCSFA